MAAVLEAPGLIDNALSTVKLARTRASDGFFYNFGLAAYEAYNAANIADYGLAMTMHGSSGIFSAADPTPTVPGKFYAILQAGGSLAVSDFADNILYEGEAGQVDGLVDALLATVVDNSISLKNALRLFMAALGGKTTGSGTTSVVYKGANGEQARISATVDGSQNRTAITFNFAD
jgi:hypothetical protein